MKAIKKILVIALVLIAVAAIGSCQKKACPAYSQVSTEQPQ